MGHLGTKSVGVGADLNELTEGCLYRAKEVTRQAVS